MRPSNRVFRFRSVVILTLYFVALSGAGRAEVFPEFDGFYIKIAGEYVRMRPTQMETTTITAPQDWGRVGRFSVTFPTSIKLLGVSQQIIDAKNTVVVREKDVEDRLIFYVRGRNAAIANIRFGVNISDFAATAVPMPGSAERSRLPSRLVEQAGRIAEGNNVAVVDSLWAWTVRDFDVRTIDDISAVYYTHPLSEFQNATAPGIYMEWEQLRAQGFFVETSDRINYYFRVE